MTKTCETIRERIWACEMNDAMLDHIGQCRECREEWEFVQEIGQAMEESVPHPARSLLPPEAAIDHVIDSHKKRKLFRWFTTAGVVAAGIVLAVQTSSAWTSLLPQQNQNPVQTQTATQQEQSVQELLQQGETADEQIDLLIKKFNLAVLPGHDQVRLTLPEYYAADAKADANADETPNATGLYFAYHNVFSQDIGLDLTPHLGQPVTARILTVAGEEVPSHRQDLRTKLVFLVRENQVIGAWMVQGGNLTAASLNRREFPQLVSLPWSDWLQEQGLHSDTPQATAHVHESPEALIRAFYQTLSGPDAEETFRYYSQARQLDFLALLNRDTLYSTDWPIRDGSLVGYLARADVTFLQELEVLVPNAPNIRATQGYNLNRTLHATRKYKVELKAEGKPGHPNVTEKGSYMIAYVTVAKETRDAPWRIETIETYPQ